MSYLFKKFALMTALYSVRRMLRLRTLLAVGLNALFGWIILMMYLAHH